MMRRINTRTELVELAKQLGTRPDWHEPDEQELTAEVHGLSFDNAGFWPATEVMAQGGVEQHVILYQEYQPVGAVNLATLFAWATGYEAPAPEVDLSPHELDSLKVQQLRDRVRALEELLTSLRPMIEVASNHQWGLVLRDLNNLLPPK